MNIVDKLMALDENALDTVETKEIEIKRLSKLVGEPFIVKVKALSSQKYIETTGLMLGSNNEVDFTKIATAQAVVCLEGVVEPNLKDKDLQKHFGCATPKELVFKLFKGGDLVKVYDAITELSGYGKDSEAEIKN